MQTDQLRHAVLTISPGPYYRLTGEDGSELLSIHQDLARPHCWRVSTPEWASEPVPGISGAKTKAREMLKNMGYRHNLDSVRE